jgi:hypothetical protein
MDRSERPSASILLAQSCRKSAQVTKRAPSLPQQTPRTHSCCMLFSFISFCIYHFTGTLCLWLRDTWNKGKTFIYIKGNIIRTYLFWSLCDIQVSVKPWLYYFRDHLFVALRNEPCMWLQMIKGGSTTPSRRELL